MNKQEALKRLAEKNLIPLEEYSVSETIWKCACQICDGSVDIENKRNSSWECRYCKYKPGPEKFSEINPAILYLIVNEKLGAAKIGVSGKKDSERMQQHEEAGWKIEKTWQLTNGADAKILEARVKRMWKNAGIKTLPRNKLPQGGYTESALISKENIKKTIKAVKPRQQLCTRLTPKEMKRKWNIVPPFNRMMGKF